MYTTLILTNTILIIIVILYKLVECYQYFSKHTKISIGTKEVKYLKKDRSKIFNSLINDINTVVEWCVQNMYPSESDTLRLLSNWKKIKMYETNFMDHVAYVIDKNKKFFLCVSTPDGEDEDHNTIRFVALHELAHMMSASYGHNKEFNTNHNTNRSTIRCRRHDTVVQESQIHLATHHHATNYCSVID